MNRSDVLSRAEDLITGDRNQSYGDTKESFRRIAAMWSAYLNWTVTPADAAAMMALLKISRISTDPTNDDHWIDLAGYAALGSEVSE